MKKAFVILITAVMTALVLVSCSGKGKGESVGKTIPEEEIETSTAGDVIVFGKYEQDNDPTNGKEDVEWLVIAKKGSKRLVISKYALDCLPFNDEYAEELTWETCSLREWLNGTFLSDAFSAEEQKMIVETKVKADVNPSFTTDPGQDTGDFVFLLSIAEANKFFGSDEARMCVPTEYALSHGAFADEENKVDGKSACWWLLRTPGDHQFLITYVFGDGTVNDYGIMITSSDYAVRPAMWIDVGN